MHCVGIRTKFQKRKKFPKIIFGNFAFGIFVLWILYGNFARFLSRYPFFQRHQLDKKFWFEWNPICFQHYKKKKIEKFICNAFTQPRVCVCVCTYSTACHIFLDLVPLCWVVDLFFFFCIFILFVVVLIVWLNRDCVAFIWVINRYQHYHLPLIVTSVAMAQQQQPLSKHRIPQCTRSSCNRITSKNIHYHTQRMHINGGGNHGDDDHIDG